MAQTEFKYLGWLRVLLIIIPYFIVVGIFQFVGMEIAGADFETINGSRTIDQQVLLSSFSLLGTFLIVFIFTKFVEHLKFINLGFHTKTRLKDFIIGIVLGAFIMGLGYLLLVLLNQIVFEKIVFEPSLILKSVLLFLIVSLTEEVLFRGYVLRNLTISFSKYVALILSSILFSLMHGFNPNIDVLGFINLFLAGILLGITYIHTKNLWFPIALHLSWNLFQSLFGFNVSGLDTYSLIEFSFNEKNLFNGGAFGFEGSILSLIAMVILIILIETYYRRKKPVIIIEEQKD